MDDSQFWFRVAFTDSCWWWLGAKKAKGYGGFTKSHGDQPLAHRHAWELYHGPIPDGLWVLHKCDNRKCVRPDHLFLGTRQDNIDDMKSKGRQNRGIVNGQSKLNDAKVKAIRYLFKNSQLTYKQLSMLFGVNLFNIGKIVRRETWSHVNDSLEEV